MNLILIIVLLFFIVWFVVLMRKMFRKYQVRKQFGRLRMHPQEIPLYSEQPFHLMFKPEVLSKHIAWKGHLFFFTIWFSLTVVLLALSFIFVLNALITVSDLLSADALLIGLFSALMSIVHVLIAIVSYQRIEADENELRVQCGLIHRRISWDRVRLFAIDRMYDAKDNVSTCDELFDGQHVVRWVNDAVIPSGTKFFTFSPTAYSQELVCLRSYICAKTDLPLRDLRPLRKQLEQEFKLSH